MSKFWNFIVNAASSTEPESVELRISGEIIDDDWAWLYEWFGIPVSSPNAFRKELSKYAGKNITVWIDSCGGSVFAGMGLFNALMEHKKTGAKIKTVGDGKVMSAATLPYAAGDERFMSPGGMFMMHNPLPGDRVYGYAADLRKFADVLDEVKESIINIYELSTGIERERISELMDNETYMSAQTAVNEGFATGILYAKNEKQDLTKNITNFNFAFSRLAIQNSAINSMEKFLEIVQQQQAKQEQQLTQPQAKAQQPKPVENNKSKGDEGMEIKNIEDLRNAYPELVAQVEAAARAEGEISERNRIKGIEAIAKNIAPNLVNKAKFEEPKDAKDLAFEALQANANLGRTYLNNAEEDSEASGAGEVPAAPADADVQDKGGKPANIVDRFKNAAANLDARRRGIKEQ